MLLKGDKRSGDAHDALKSWRAARHSRVVCGPLAPVPHEISYLSQDQRDSIKRLTGSVLPLSGVVLCSVDLMSVPKPPCCSQVRLLSLGRHRKKAQPVVPADFGGTPSSRGTH